MSEKDCVVCGKTFEEGCHHRSLTTYRDAVPSQSSGVPTVSVDLAMVDTLVRGLDEKGLTESARLAWSMRLEIQEWREISARRQEAQAAWEAHGRALDHAARFAKIAYRCEAALLAAIPCIQADESPYGRAVLAAAYAALGATSSQGEPRT